MRTNTNSILNWFQVILCWGAILLDILVRSLAVILTPSFIPSSSLHILNLPILSAFVCTTAHFRHLWFTAGVINGKICPYHFLASHLQWFAIPSRMSHTFQCGIQQYGPPQNLVPSQKPLSTGIFISSNVNWLCLILVKKMYHLLNEIANSIC